MKSGQESKAASIEREGDSKEILSNFPDEVKATLGFSLRQIQKLGRVSGN
jgi:hypothetical protein